MLRGRALVGITILRYLSGQLPAARTAAREATAAAEQTDDATLRATAGMYRAYMDAAAGDLRAAEELLAATAHDHLPTWIRAERAMVAGQLRRARHDPRGALAVLTEAEDLAEECGHTWAWGSARWIAAKIMIDAGCGVEAAQVLVEVLQRFTTDGDRTSALAVLHTLAATGAATGRLLDAATLFGAVAALGRRIGYDPVRMDPVDGPRHRALVLDQMPPRLVEQALARGAGLSLREALALAQSLADVGSHAA